MELKSLTNMDFQSVNASFLVSCPNSLLWFIRLKEIQRQLFEGILTNVSSENFLHNP